MLKNIASEPNLEFKNPDILPWERPVINQEGKLVECDAERYISYEQLKANNLIKHRIAEIIIESKKHDLDQYCCPITGQIMLNPYITPEGYTYDYQSITKSTIYKANKPYFKDPHTQTLVPTDCLRKDTLTATLINDFLEQNPHLKNEVYIPKEIIDNFIEAAKLGIADEVRTILEQYPSILTAVIGTILQLDPSKVHDIVVDFLSRPENDELLPTIFQLSYDSGYTCLHYAAKHNHKAIVNLLLQKGANPNAQIEFGSIALHFAAFVGNEEIANSLLAYGSNTLIQNKLDYTPSKLAEIYSKNESIKQAIDRYTEKQQQFIEAIKNSDVGTLTSLSQQSPFLLTQPLTAQGRSALYIALECNNVNDSLKFLLSQPAIKNNINCLDSSGFTILHWAAYHGRFGLIKPLIAAGANPDSVTPTPNTTTGAQVKETPLHIAVAQGHLKTIAALIPHGTALKKQNAVGQTPLKLAQNKAQESSSSAIRVALLENIPKILTAASEQNEQENPLNTFEQAIESLVSYRYLSYEDILAFENAQGKSVLALAEENPLLKDSEYFKKIKAIAKSTPELIVAIRDNKREELKNFLTTTPELLTVDLSEKGKTAIHFAAESNHVEPLQTLLGEKAELSRQTDLMKRSPLHYALCDDDPKRAVEKVKLLIEHGATLEFKQRQDLLALTKNKNIPTKTKNAVTHWIEHSAWIRLENHARALKSKNNTTAQQKGSNIIELLQKVASTNSSAERLALLTQALHDDKYAKHRHGGPHWDETTTNQLIRNLIKEMNPLRFDIKFNKENNGLELTLSASTALTQDQEGVLVAILGKCHQENSFSMGAPQKMAKDGFLFFATKHITTVSINPTMAGERNNETHLSIEKYQDLITSLVDFGLITEDRAGSVFGAIDSKFSTGCFGLFAR